MVQLHGRNMIEVAYTATSIMAPETPAMLYVWMSLARPQARRVLHCEGSLVKTKPNLNSGNITVGQGLTRFGKHNLSQNATNSYMA